jgi:hypothetical protein
MYFQNPRLCLCCLEIGLVRHSQGKKGNLEIPCLPGNIVEHLH